jgi:hypothetical protein
VTTVDETARLLRIDSTLTNWRQCSAKIWKKRKTPSRSNAFDGSVSGSQEPKKRSCKADHCSALARGGSRSSTVRARRHARGGVPQDDRCTFSPTHSRSRPSVRIVDLSHRLTMATGDGWRCDSMEAMSTGLNSPSCWSRRIGRLSRAPRSRSSGPHRALNEFPVQSTIGSFANPRLVSECRRTTSSRRTR